jgi:transcriptional regulator with XRE-family HTH domain
MRREMITSAQIRAARGQLGLSQVLLATLAGISPTALLTIETGANDPNTSALVAIVKALEAEGVEFLDGVKPSVRLAKTGSAPQDPLKAENGAEFFGQVDYLADDKKYRATCYAQMERYDETVTTEEPTTRIFLSAGEAERWVSHEADRRGFEKFELLPGRTQGDQ